MPNAALILAAGRGSRIQNRLADKILAPLSGRPAITYSIEAFLASGSVTTLVILFRDKAQQAAIQVALENAGLPCGSILWVPGGSERQESVLAGLRALPAETDLVFIHDAARPLITPDAIRSLAMAAESSGAACLAHRVTDTIKQLPPDFSPEAPARLRTIDRSRLWSVETPQVFRYQLILEAYEKTAAAGVRITDDTSALEESGHPVTLVESPEPNPKVTTPADLAYVEYLLQSRTESLQ